jgi:hypothetical protein
LQYCSMFRLQWQCAVGLAAARTSVFLGVHLIKLWQLRAVVLLIWPRAWSFPVFACACS